jgi:DNA-binding NarL/FixJ family response regulator
MNKTPSIALVVEDHASSRQWLLETLEIAFPGITCHDAENVKSANDEIDQSTPDIALIDLNLPDGSGVDIIRRLRQSTDCQCIVTTIYDDDHHLFPALRAGASGYILKEHSKDAIADLLRGIVNGAPPLSPSVARRLLQHYEEPSSKEANLTPREREVLVLIAKGFHVKRVAQLLDITPNTCSGYVKIIYRKLDISSRAEATLEATRLGYISAS